jgi:hypothetical protein
MNAGVPFSPYTGDISSHEALVQKYFIGAGLPADQVGGVRTNVGATGTGALGGERVTEQYFYSSIITRAVNGIPVDESHAWARLDVNGNVVAENVYWPALNASVISDAVALSQTVASTSPISATYLGSLPVPASVASIGKVVIHHSSEFVRTTFEDYACYDVQIVPSLGGGYVRHFDKNGAEIRLPQELRTGGSAAIMNK